MSLSGLKKTKESDRYCIMACLTTKRGRTVIDFYDQNGHRRQKTLPKGISKTEAKKILREIENQVEKGSFISSYKMPLFSKVAHAWFEYKMPDIRESTCIQYQGHISNHLNPFFGKARISRINFNSIEQYITHSHRSGVTPATLKKTLTTLGSILKYAMKKRYIDSNPIQEMERKRGSTSNGKKKIIVLQPEEICALIENARPLKYKVLFMTAVMTGMRAGELLGLKWDDIDFNVSQVNVKRTHNYGKFHEPKTQASIRSIDLSPMLIHELKKWKLACPPNELNLVFPNEKGRPIDYHNISKRYFWPALKRAGLQRIRFHDLRHTYAALLIDQGEHPKYIQSQLGHSSIKVTLDTYGHLMKDINAEAPRRLDEKIFGAKWRHFGDISGKSRKAENENP